MTITLYKVGGFVRDKFLGVKSKDIDYAVEAPSYEAMRFYIVENGGQIFVETPQYFTIRAKLGNEAADFVLCRKESFYTDGRRPDSVELGTIDDDLARRDFTMNAMALRQDGSLYDPHGGLIDLQARLLRCVGDAYTRFDEDALRLLRAIRFHITKQVKLHEDIIECLDAPRLLIKLAAVSKERIREELNRCFKADTIATLDLLGQWTDLRRTIFRDASMWLEATHKSKD